ncbi:hypothetical protein ACFPOG_12445 [Paenibacillus aestuarii]|uniref:Uncharacterized protein n=1 Tax=Paenibacillus aestuarii TaxID=516965 RepID=A0ABW0K760_9BACL
MRAYSQLDLLSKTLGLLGKSRISSGYGIINDPRYVSLNIRTPHYDLLRGRQCIKDIAEILGDEMDLSFTVESLFVLLYADFIRQIRNGANLLELAKILMHGKRYFKKMDTPVEAELVSKNSFVLVREERPNRARRENQLVDVPIRIHKDEAERGEYLLYDMEELYPEFDMTVEELISIRYREFMKAVKSGNMDVVKAVIANVKRSRRYV